MPKIKKSKEEVPKKINQNLARVKGLKDILPEEYKYWELVGRKAQEMGRVYGFRRCDVPVLEGLELYEKGLGRSSEVCAKDLLSFVTKSGERLALRPDAAVSLARSFLEHGLISPETTTKSFWLGPVFAFDRYQGGRLRQWHQWSLDVLGDFGPAADAQLMMIGYNFFKELQVEVDLHINSLGDAECRENYVKVINNYFKERGRKSKLCPDCRKRLLKQPLLILDCREEKCQGVAADLSPIVDCLSDDSRKRFEQVLDFLDNLGIPYNLDTRLVSVRGFDFFSKTIFEFMPAGENRKHLSLGGGGNYDQLMAKLGGKNIKACGLAVDLERAISRIRSKNISVAENHEADIFIAQISDGAKQKAAMLFEELRRAGFNVREYFISDSLKAQLEEAEKAKVKFTLILGQKEMIDGTILLKDMESGVQETVDLRKIVNELDKRMHVG